MEGEEEDDGAVGDEGGRDAEDEGCCSTEEFAAEFAIGDEVMTVPVLDDLHSNWRLFGVRSLILASMEQVSLSFDTTCSFACPWA